MSSMLQRRRSLSLNLPKVALTANLPTYPPSAMINFPIQQPEQSNHDMLKIQIHSFFLKICLHNSNKEPKFAPKINP